MFKTKDLIKHFVIIIVIHNQTSHWMQMQAISIISCDRRCLLWSNRYVLHLKESVYSWYDHFFIAKLSDKDFLRRWVRIIRRKRRSPATQLENGSYCYQKILIVAFDEEAVLLVS